MFDFSNDYAAIREKFRTELEAELRKATASLKGRLMKFESDSRYAALDIGLRSGQVITIFSDVVDMGSKGRHLSALVRRLPFVRKIRQILGAYERIKSRDLWVETIDF